MKKNEILEEAFGFKLGDPRVMSGINFILKNWNHEKETYSEWYERTFKQDKISPQENRPGF